MDTYADDLSELLKKLDLKSAVLIGFSAGGGEVARYIGRHGTKLVAKAALISAVPPLMLKTAANPGGLPIEKFDAIRLGSIADRSQLYKDLASGPFFGANRPSRQGFARHDRHVLAPGDAGRRQEHFRLYQGVLRDGFHRRPQEIRRADADHSWRR